MGEKTLKPVYKDEWVVIGPRTLQESRMRHSAYYFPIDVTDERDLSEALKEHNNHPPYLVWDGNLLKIFYDPELARQACTGSISVIFKAHTVVENDKKKVEWTETKERTFD